MADSKITALDNLTSADPANDMIPIVDVSATPPASGNTKRISINNLLACSPSATLASATITGDLTVATDRLKVVTASTAIQTGATTQLQVGTTSWPSTVIGKSGSRSLFGNTGEVVIWSEAAPAIGNYSTLFVTAKTGAGATTMGGLQIRAGIENASNSDGFVSLWTSNNTAGGFVERYKIDSTGIATWSNVGGVAGTAMTLNSTGLGVGVTPGSAIGNLQVGGSSNANLYVQQGTDTIRMGVRASGRTGIILDSSNATYTNRAWYLDNVGSSGSLVIGRQGLDVITFDNSGNCGIGVTPSAWNSNYNALDIGQNGTISGRVGSSNTVDLASNGFRNTSGNWVYKLATSNTACRYQLDGSTGSHIWYSGAAGTAGNTIAGFSSALMTLDASGNLILQPPSSPPTLGTNGQLTVNATSNTNLRFSYRGSDGVTRVANITLA